ncbi:hypothetical protein E1162_01965 [Rhodobacteraceae bacterium RKSG542]|uniref:hypothetical protein n=1 Tax=Pseudovibrio flavus TaxID=2529854 RepID=UPI0012BBFE0D|nr:hypothetical protein [Pseudovibrio flavus]MTI16000.1 hypothetical protein [Pseudovibrio flavus]
MAYATLFMVNPETGSLKEAPVGFSWTTLFFSFFPALLRGHLSLALLQLVLAVLTGGLSGLVFMFIYNKLYIKHLLSRGFLVKSATQPVDLLSHRLSLYLPEA